MPTIGQKLEETRLTQGLSIEDVAYETRIRPAMLVSIENDDFSLFPSVAYARSFIRKYSRFLGLDLEETIDALSSNVTRLHDSGLLGDMKRMVKQDRRFRWGRSRPRSSRRRDRRRSTPIFLNLMLVILMAALGIFYFLGFHARTPEQARIDIARGLGLPLPPTDPATEEENIENHQETEESSDSSTDTGATKAADIPDKDASPQKENIDLPMEDPLLPPDSSSNPRDKAANQKRSTQPPKPRPTPALNLDGNLPQTNATPPSLGNSPLVTPPPPPEPEITLRPKGTEPATPRTPQPSNTSPSAEEAAPTSPPLRAIPIPERNE